MTEHPALRALDEDRARELIDTIRASVSVARDAIVEAWQGRAWIALGYESWSAMCDAELGVRLGLPPEQRLELTRDLSGQGMSTRAIGTAIGVSQATAARVVRESDDSPAVTGLDGKTYARRPPVDTSVLDARIAKARESSRQSRFVTVVLRESVKDLIAVLNAIQPSGLDDEYGLPAEALILERITELHEAAAGARRRLSPLRSVR